MQDISYEDVVKIPLSDGAILRNDFPGFREDYLVLHCLIRKILPKTFIEIGTSTGSGTNVICNAIGQGSVFSIDVPPGTDPSIIYPNHEDGHPGQAGATCRFPYVQLFGFSEQFDYSPYYPIEGWFIDAKHDYPHCSLDTLNALKASPRLIVWHDMQMEGVDEAVRTVMGSRSDYDVRRVLGTRIAYGEKK